MNLLYAPIAHEGFFATHFFTVKDQEKSKDFYVRILGGKVIKAENPCYIKLANAWIILNSGGSSTPDKPEVFLETPSNPTSDLRDAALRLHRGEVGYYRSSNFVHVDGCVCPWWSFSYAIDEQCVHRILL